MPKNIKDEKVSRTEPITEHITILRFSWALEKLGYILMFAIVILALLGGFSNGIMSKKEGANPENTLRINYERFVRYGTQTQWTIKIKDNENAPISFNITDSIENFYIIENIQPQSALVSHQGQSLHFTIPDNEKQQWYTFTFILRPKAWGSFNATVSGIGAVPVVINQWGYP
ncbi:hypothetical protein [Serratia liquefaciens]|uniref:hypothetical protein n=1 Tax=Serratia liquefaciens TaxID=614 RepID=UPI002361AC8E|nr:hypothetical protein [Serratia liquefaciens]